MARVVDGPEEASVYTRISFGAAAAAKEGVAVGATYPAVTLALSKKKGTNAVHVAHEVVARAEALAREVLPADVQMRVTRNTGETANEKVDELLVHLLLAIVTVVGLVAFALGWREGLIVAAAVPITFALTLLVNLLAGYTINRVTLFALVLVAGPRLRRPDRRRREHPPSLRAARSCRRSRPCSRRSTRSARPSSSRRSPSSCRSCRCCSSPG